MPPAADSLHTPRRVYTAVTVIEGEGGFAVTLDDRAARTPAGARLQLATRALADLVAGEWSAQDRVVDLARMPATRLAFTAIDAGPPARAALAEEVARYAGSDLLCYFADGPEALRAEQAARWGPMLDWAEAALALRLVRARGVMHRPQPEATVARAGVLARALDVFALTGLALATALYGSAILAFAVQRRRLSGEEAFDLSRLDEGYQEARWGLDAEAAARTAELRAQARMLDRWFTGQDGDKAGADHASAAAP